MYKRCVCAAQFTLHKQKVFLLIIQHLHLISASSNVVDLLNMQHFSGTLYLLWAFIPPAVWNVFDGALVLFFFWLVFPKTKRPPNKHLPEKKKTSLLCSLFTPRSCLSAAVVCVWCLELLLLPASYHNVNILLDHHVHTHTHIYVLSFLLVFFFVRPHHLPVFSCMLGSRIVGSIVYRSSNRWPKSNKICVNTLIICRSKSIFY